MPRFLRFLASFALLAVAASGGGCSQEPTPCALGEHSPEEAIEAFLTAASRNDPDGVQGELPPMLDVDKVAVSELAAVLENEDRSSWRLWPSQMGAEHIYRVTTSSGALVGTFSVGEWDPECWCVAWGLEGQEGEPT
ncbi:MAG: hypothetical protein LBK95_09425 [Bifidobacteriaceae bacterium]|nr:hypothetical protein [Bifidobacteriaceae bacterium]